MKKKGFTLIELLAVIVILSVITLITVPMITSVIEESKKKALVSSVQGLIESANLYAVENEGVYEFLFDREHQGSTVKGEELDYKGSIDGEGKLYIDKEGNTSICISNDKYYAYKNYNSEIRIGERNSGNCIIGFDALTNKYIAMLDDGTGQVSNVYSKDEVDNLVDGKVTELNHKIETNTNEISNIKSNIEELQNNLNNYAHQSELEKTNANIENLSNIVGNNKNDIYNLKDSFSEIKSKNSIDQTLFVTTGSSGYIGDLNEIRTPGMYEEVIASYAKNGPGFFSYLLVFRYTGTDNVTQVAFGYNENKIAIRFYYGGQGWSNWTLK